MEIFNFKLHLINGKYFVEIYDNCIFHYRGGTWLGLNNIELHKKLLNKLKLI